MTAFIRDFARPELSTLRPYQLNSEGLPVRLDSNESPFDLPDRLKQTICDELRTVAFNRYPGLLALSLRARISSMFGMDDDQITMGNGLDEVIHIILQTFGPGKKVVVQKPSFSTYAYAAVASGAELVEVPLSQGPFGLKPDVESLVEQAGDDPCIVFLCNPHNPTGGRVATSEIETLVRETRSLIVVDEAYAEFSGESTMSLVNRYDRLIVLRTLSKAFGLAGVRVGYAVSSLEVAAELNKVRQPFNIDSLSLVAAGVALDHPEYCEKAISAIVRERERMMSTLARMPGVKCLPSYTNFILFRTGMPGQVVWEQLRKRGIAIRMFASEPALVGYLRVSCGTTRENDAFLNALAEIIAFGGDQ